MTGMFISRSTHNEQDILKNSCKMNKKSVLLTSNYWSLCRHPYYLGKFNKPMTKLNRFRLVYCLGNFLILLSWALPCNSMSIPWILPAYYLLVICYKNCSKDLVSQWRRKKERMFVGEFSLIRKKSSELTHIHVIPLRERQSHRSTIVYCSHYCIRTLFCVPKHKTIIWWLPFTLFPLAV